MTERRADPRRRLPAVDALLAEPDIAALVAAHPRSLVVRAVREAIDAARAIDGAAPAEGWGAAVLARAHRLAAPSFGPVINATGVVLHTNLGRAPLARGAIDAMGRIAAGYSNLEYDLAHGMGKTILAFVHDQATAGVADHATRSVAICCSSSPAPRTRWS